MHPDVHQEQAYFDRALELRERLETNALSARQEADRETARDLRRRVGALGVVDPGIAVAFGRIDADGQQWYIGKGAIWDEDNELVVVNWQAPVAAPFYRASPEDPEGLDARRIFRCAPGNRIRDIEEHVFAGRETAVRSGAPPAPAAAAPAAPGNNSARPGSATPPRRRPAPERPGDPPAPGPQDRVDTGPTPAVPTGTSRPQTRPDERPMARPGRVERSRPGAVSTESPDADVLRSEHVEAGRHEMQGSYDRGVPRPDTGQSVPSRVSHTVEVFRATEAGGYVRETGSVEVVRLSENDQGHGPTEAAAEAPVTPHAGTPAVPAGSEPRPRPATRQPGRAGPPPSPARGGPPEAAASEAVAAEPVAPDPVTQEPGLPGEPAASRARPVSDALLDALERARSGELSDIVATIQSAQYDVITRDIDQLLVVQGGPGTGKTVVGLHRVSWILYNRRAAWQPNDVLVVGPNDAFVRYISAVLPSLGDDAVVQLPISGLGPRAEVTRTDPVDLRALKGDRRMQRLLLRAIRNRQKPQRGPVELNVAGRTVRLDGDGVVAQARQLAGQPHNEARRALRAYLIDEVQTFFHRRGLRGVAAIGDMAETESTRGIDEYLERVWPAMTPQKFLVDLFAKRRRLEAAGVGLLTGDEIDSLLIAPDTRVEDATWSVDDIALLDLADSLLNGTPVTYEHIVVDEAQDLTPMQFESIRRRSRTGSMTILGDLAQGTTPWSPDSWEEAVLHLRRDRVPTEIAELTIGYRLPQEVHDVAMRLLPEIAPRLREPEAVRVTGDRVEVSACHPRDLRSRIVEAVRRRVGNGLVGVIVSERGHADVAEALTGAGHHWTDHLTTDGPAIVVLTAEECRGLELDSIIVVEPADIAGESPRGLRALFVALTRTTGTLVLVHSELLPSALELDSPVPDEPARQPEPQPEPPARPDPGRRSTDEGPGPQRQADFDRLPDPVFQAGYEEIGPRANGDHSGDAVNGDRKVNGGPAPDGDRDGTVVGGGPLSADPWAPAPASERDRRPPPSGSLVARNQAGDEMERYDHGAVSAGASPAAQRAPEPSAMERAMARAIAGELTDALSRYVTPALAPLVLEEMRQTLAERFPPGTELPAGDGAEQVTSTRADQPAPGDGEPDDVLDIRR